MEALSILSEEVQYFLSVYQLAWLLPALLILSIISITISPILLSLLPENYFIIKRKIKPKTIGNRLVSLLRTTLGLIIIFLGIIMLIAPGQGLLTIALGLVVVDLSGKDVLMRKIILHNPTFKTLNWVRNAFRKPSFLQNPPDAETTN